MVRKYIDINSGYRDRISYPNVCDFVIPTNTASSKNTPTTAADPVILAFPYEANLLSGGSSTTQIALSVLASNFVNFYEGSYIVINGEYRLCTKYDNSSQIATVNPGFSVAPAALTPYTVRFALPIPYAPNVYQDVTSNNSATLNEIYLPLSASNKDNYYVDNYVFLAGSILPSTYQYKRIVSYNGTTKRAVIQGIFSSLVTAGTIVEILRYSYDNVQSLRFYGTETMNNPVCTNISLDSLLIPNLQIRGSYGTLQNYSHIYVSVYGDKGCTYNYPIVSNNPNVARALFKVPITYLQNISYLTLGSGMSQTVSFRINDTLRITIFLPDGKILAFQTTSPNTYFENYPQFPIPSDPVSQVQVVLGLDLNTSS